VWLVVLVVVGSLALGGPPGGVEAAGAAASSGAAAEPECADTAATAQAAAAIAAECDRSVEIVGERTETDQVFAEPDGSTTLRRYATPQRVHQGDGWVDVDPTLRVEEDGSVRPEALPFPLELSGGGTGPFVRITDGEPTLALTWPTPLPRPTLDGATATYPDVLPGVDLQLTATVEGFEQLLVVKDREAAANPALARIATRVTTDGLTLKAGDGGRLSAVDAAGKAVFVSDGSAMWDSPGGNSTDGTDETDGADGTAGADAADPAAHAVPMGVELQGDQVVITPDQELLQDPDTEYPVLIDPPWSRGSGTNWTTVDSCNPSTSYWSSRRDVMRVGHNPTGGCRNRAFVNIDIGDLAGSTIKTASFFSNMDHSSPCGSPTPEVRLAVTTEQWIRPWNAVTLNNTSNYGAYWGWVIKTATPASANETYKNGRWTCGRDLEDKLVEWGGDIRDPNNMYVPDVVQWFTNRAYPTLTFSIYSTSESDDATWKKFYADSSFLQVNYNHPPNVPTGQAISDCSARCSSPAVVSRRDPQISASATDPNGGNLKLTFAVQKADGTPVITSPEVAQASGATPAPWRISPALPADGAYRWRVTSCDDWGDCATSGWFAFAVDSLPPPAPQVEPVDPNLYFRDDGSGRSSGGIGVPGQLLLKGSLTTDVFIWRLDNGPATTVAATGTDPRTATITVVPTADLVRTLTVTVRKVAGKETTSTYRFRVAPPDPIAGYWDLDGDALDSRDLSGRPNAVRHDGTVTGATFADVTVPGTVQSPRFHGVAFDGATTSAAAAVVVDHPVLATVRNPATPDVARSFSVAAWVRFDGSVAEGRYRTAVSQQGTNKSHFELGFQTGTESNFCFTLFAADSLSAAPTRVCATGPVTTGEWVHLAGVYDDAAHTATLYVHRLNPLGFVDLDGAATATRSFTSTWAANGPFTIGRAYHGGPSAGFKGIVDEIYAAQYAATAEDVQGWAGAFDLAE
jgi:hypothetical protein